jgi:iron complex outermembrane receptor protein
LRWSREAGDWKVSGGFFYLEDKIDFNYSLGLGLFPTAPYFLTIPLNLTHQESTSDAIYGQAVYSATDRLRFTIGGRASHDQIEAAGNGSFNNSFPPFSFNGTHVQPDGKIGVDYDLAPRVLIYANIQTGYIPFGYNPVPTTPNESNEIPRSRLLAYSAGIKSRFLDNRLEVNDEPFYYDYRDFQAVAFNGNTGVSSAYPAKRSLIYGNEFTLRAVLPADTQLDAGLLIQSAHYTEFYLPGLDYSGHQMVDAPFANLIVGLQHTLHLGSAGDILGRVSSHYESGHYGDYSNVPNTHQSAYTKTDASLTYTPASGAWSVQAYGRNLENAAVFGSLSPGNSPLTDPGQGNIEPPRTFGIRFTMSWK